jgi:hypothetical protein
LSLWSLWFAFSSGQFTRNIFGTFGASAAPERIRFLLEDPKNSGNVLDLRLTALAFRGVGRSITLNLRTVQDTFRGEQTLNRVESLARDRELPGECHHNGEQSIDIRLREKIRAFALRGGIRELDDICGFHIRS